MNDDIAGRKVILPDKGKFDGGSHFDDEMEDAAEHKKKFQEMVVELIKHINTRKDHTVYVGSADDRFKMRAVFNSLKEGGLIGHWPTIKIDYGVPEGTIRVDEDRD